ncbi:Tripartite-type tricarboxylate transporter, receptor component TctC [Noviherbaspirillum humi]|uniref:Tripartite-type tricarboxylate transporter, receptor component TctC n=1 Tax=Noviherbaspirillum humi TaxID=1688639 RepID=A0A239JWQ7_9BURK|nr:tripartite tricarboxylate transporter substrate binding protein [Noviherbaspirillum humi]SNT10109.1 Tripartite-type tricarboxylate transporter, receptor component TctC [Noviherbaspirillum humi]
MKRRTALAASLAIALTAAGLGAAQAQSGYPDKPIRVIIGYAPGGGTDLIARVLTQRMSEGLKQPIIIENKPGAQSIIAAQFVAKSAPDGYTLFFAPTGPISMNPAIHSKLPYSSTKDFAPIAMIGSFPLILTVAQNSPAKNVKQLVEFAKANPAKANYGASAAPFQLAAELFNQKTGTAFQYIGYKGSNESVNAVASGDITMTLADPPVVVGPAKSGRVRPLAITAASRHPSWPDVPTLVESGVPDMDIALWAGFLAPAGTPQPIIQRLQEEIARVVKLPDVQERLAGLGVDAAASTPEEFSRVISRDIAKWTAVAKTANIKAD